MNKQDNKVKLRYASDTYAFISYLHSDTAKVDQFRYIFDRECIRYWYDGYIPVSSEWEATINEHLKNCRVFVSFISNGIEQRSEVIREIEMALSLEKKIIIIFLEKVPLDVFSDELRKKIGKSQFIELRKTGGITDKLVKALINNSVWPEEVVDDEKRKNLGKEPWSQAKVDANAALESIEKMRESENPYIYQKAEPKLDERTEGENTDSDKGIKFYKVKTDEINPDAVYPICFDNQWLPVSVFKEKEFIDEGFKSKKVQKIVREAQQKEMFRALIHNWQLIINRATIYNTELFVNWYENEDRDFISLLANGSIVMYLFKENSPWDEINFGKRGDSEKIKSICRKTPIYCLKIDWDNNTENQKQISRNIGYKFQEVCLTTYDNDYRLESLCDIMKIKDSQREQFREKWGEIQKDVIERKPDNNNKRPIYTREVFYQKFVVDNKNVPECKISKKKSFAREVKQIVDFYYSINLPNALNIRPLLPDDSPFKNYFISEARTSRLLRETSFEELNYAISVFSDDFLEEIDYIADESGVDLSFVTAVRSLPEWKTYMRTVDGSKKQASINEINFNEI
ncbi:MAG: toll/interleukin-1 receptor domain-containing protein, partial [Oscillospiraceae bacterium]|nr:toll/interleukin-1 receptor domain-containing protein [Oscillospiraceae bacterium]